MNPETEKNAAWYALRRTLPPWKFEENLSELLLCARKYRIDEVVIKVDTEDFHHGHGIQEWLRAYQPKLHLAREALNDIGVEYSLNPWITLGHAERGRDSIAQLPGLQTVVAFDGKQGKNRACPMSPVWRDNVSKLWTLYAETRPLVIWLEDDMKFHLGGGCFCPLHLAAFSERVGRRVEREELAEALNAPGEPHPWRVEYLTLLADTVIDAARLLRESVQAVSPETCMGLMSSGPRSHCRSGHRWKELAAALGSGKTKVFSRPPLGSYSEGSLRALYQTQDSIKITRHCIGEDAIDQTEVENSPFSRYSKSATFTFIQMAVSFAYGARGVTLNLFDHLGHAMEKTPEFGRMLGDQKPFLNSLAELAQQPGQYRGVHLPHRDVSGMRAHVAPGSRFSYIEDGWQMAEMLEGCGIPTTFAEGEIVALQGQIVRSLEDSEIREMLARGLLVDGTAAGILVERGFGHEIGIESVEASTQIFDLGPVAAEEICHPRFGGYPRNYLTAKVPQPSDKGRICRMKAAPGAIEVSRLVDADEKVVCPASFAFENSLGGRVFIMAHELACSHSESPGMLNPSRCDLLRAVQRWLGRGEPPAQVDMDGVYPMLFRKDMADKSIVGVFNLTLDAWPGAVITLSDKRAPKRVEILMEDGSWGDCECFAVESGDGLTRIEFMDEIEFKSPLVFAAHWED